MFRPRAGTSLYKILVTIARVAYQGVGEGSGRVTRQQTCRKYQRNHVSGQIFKGHDPGKLSD